MEFDYVLLMSKQHPLAPCSSVVIEDLEKYTELVDGDVYVPFIPKHAYNRTNPSGEKSRRIYLYERSSQFDLLRNVTTTYMWSSPLPPSTLKNYQLIQRKCSGCSTRYKDLIIYRTDYRLTPYAAQFFHVLLHTIKTIPDDFI